jgi:HTH-type transcriptional regulator / antitoxin HipB
MKYTVRMSEQMGAVLQDCRKKAGLTQQKAASKVGLFPKTISALELDPSRSRIASLFKLLSALDLELVIQPKNKASKNDQDAW